MDRNDLIKALSNAFAEPEPEKPELRSTVQSAVAGEKDVLRLMNFRNAGRAILILLPGN